MADRFVLADTSVWIHYFRRRKPEVHRALNQLMDELRLSIAPSIVAELLAGARGKEEIAQAEELLGMLPCVDLEKGDWIEAGRFSRECRRAGRSVPLLDCLLAAAAVRSSHLLWSFDQDFDRLETFGLKRFQA